MKKIIYHIIAFVLLVLGIAFFAWRGFSDLPFVGDDSETTPAVETESEPSNTVTLEQPAEFFLLSDKFAELIDDNDYSFGEFQSLLPLPPLAIPAENFIAVGIKKDDALAFTAFEIQLPPEITFTDFKNSIASQINSSLQPAAFGADSVYFTAMNGEAINLILVEDDRVLGFAFPPENFAELQPLIAQAVIFS